MALLARNVSTNCGGTDSSTNRSEAREQGGLSEEEEACRLTIADGDADRAEGVLSRGQGTARRSSPPSTVCVQELRWGDGGQLAGVLAKFGGCGPDIVLA